MWEGTREQVSLPVFTRVPASVDETKASHGMFIVGCRKGTWSSHCLGLTRAWFPIPRTEARRRCLICFLSEERKQNTSFMLFLQEFRNIQTVFEGESQDPLEGVLEARAVRPRWYQWVGPLLEPLAPSPTLPPTTPQLLLSQVRESRSFQTTG